MVVLGLTACASTPGVAGSRISPKEPLHGGVAEFQLSAFDGHVIEGRVLVGATRDPLVIDGRLAEWFAVSLTEVHECEKSELLDFWSSEVLLPPPKSDEIIHLRRGAWYGSDVRFPLLSNEKSVAFDGWPCVEAVLVVRSIDMRIAAKLPIRVVRAPR